MLPHTAVSCLARRPDPRLTVRQIVELRFASDDEFAALAARAADENLSEDAIKRPSGPGGPIPTGSEHRRNENRTITRSVVVWSVACPLARVIAPSWCRFVPAKRLP